MNCKLHPQIKSAYDDVKFTSGSGMYHTNEPAPDNPGKKLREYVGITWAEIVAMVDAPQNCDKQDCQWFIPSTLPSRKGSDQRENGMYFALWADLDKNTRPIEQLAVLMDLMCECADFEIYTTKSAKPELQRCRLLIPLAMPLPAATWELAQRVLNDKLSADGFEPDRSAERLSQLCYLPNKGDFYDSCFSRDGKLLDVEYFWRHELQALSAKPCVSANDGNWLVQPPVPPLVALFNYAFTVEEILIEAGYSQKGTAFRHPSSESGSYSATVKNNRVHTMSSNDPLYTGGGGGGAHDAYSAFTVLTASNDELKAKRLALSKLREAGIEVPAELMGAVHSQHLIELNPIGRVELQSAKLTPRVILPGLIYADVRIRVSAGGTGKTTVALFEAITLALGNELWGQKPPAPIKTVMVTHEDSREILVARMRIILNEMFLNSEEIDQVLNNVQILDVSGTGYRLSRIDEDVVQPHFENIDAMVEAFQLFQPDWIIFDPLVSFGVGESRVNDAEQGLIEAFRVFRNKLDCCIEGIHHTGKANAREKTSDQYSGRGGSALADGSRMVVVMLPVEAQEWFQKTGIPLGDD